MSENRDKTGPEAVHQRVTRALEDFDYFFDRWILATPLKSFLIFLGVLIAAIMLWNWRF